MPLVIDSGTPADQLEAFTAAVEAGRSVAMVHTQWPDPLRRAAAADVEKARHGDELDPLGKIAVFTSGSSGRPRAVVRSIGSWQASVQPLADLLGMSDSDVVWAPGPLSSTLTLYGAWQARSLGLRVVLGYRPHPARLGRVTMAHVVPSMLPTLLAAHSSGLAPRLGTIVVAGDHVPSTAPRVWADRGVRLVEYYGAAELSFTGWRSVEGFVPFPGARVDIRDDELWVSSPYLAEGYLTPDDTAPLRTAEGWATVGDRACWLDQAGSEFLILGRGDAAVTTGGQTVLVADLESRLRKVPGVEGVMVTGVPDSRLGQVVVAVVTGVPDWRQMRGIVDGLPAEARPRRWARPERLPQLPNGKLDRAMVNVALLDGALSTGPLPTG